MSHAFLFFPAVDGLLIDVTSSSVLSVFKYHNSSTKVISSVGVQLNRTIQGAKFICHTELQTPELGIVYRNSTQAHTVNALCKSSNYHRYIISFIMYYTVLHCMILYYTVLYCI